MNLSPPSSRQEGWMPSTVDRKRPCPVPFAVSARKFYKEMWFKAKHSAPSLFFLSHQRSGMME